MQYVEPGSTLSTLSIICENFLTFLYCSCFEWYQTCFLLSSKQTVIFVELIAKSRIFNFIVGISCDLLPFIMSPQWCQLWNRVLVQFWRYISSIFPETSCFKFFSFTRGGFKIFANLLVGASVHLGVYIIYFGKLSPTGPKSSW